MHGRRNGPALDSPIHFSSPSVLLDPSSLPQSPMLTGPESHLKAMHPMQGAGHIDRPWLINAYFRRGRLCSLKRPDVPMRTQFSTRGQIQVAIAKCQQHLQ